MEEKKYLGLLNWYKAGWLLFKRIGNDEQADKIQKRAEQLKKDFKEFQETKAIFK